MFRTEKPSFTEGPAWHPLTPPPRQSWWCVTCELLVLAKERRQHLAQYHAKQSLSVSTAFQPADAASSALARNSPSETQSKFSG